MGQENLHKFYINYQIFVDAHQAACYNFERAELYPLDFTESTCVNNSKNPLRLNVGYLYNKPIGTNREIPIDYNELEIEDLHVKGLISQVRISRTREGLLLQVNVEAEIESICARCLKDFFLPVNAAFEELYQFPSRYREETDKLLSDDGYIDLKPIYREFLILAVPIKRLCKPDCKGLCPVCGADLNEGTCEHQQESGAIEGKSSA